MKKLIKSRAYPRDYTHSERVRFFFTTSVWTRFARRLRSCIAVRTTCFRHRLHFFYLYFFFCVIFPTLRAPLGTLSWPVTHRVGRRAAATQHRVASLLGDPPRRYYDGKKKIIIKKRKKTIIIIPRARHIAAAAAAAVTSRRDRCRNLISAAESSAENNRCV